MEVPLSLVSPVLLSDKSSNGFFLPHKASESPMLAFNLEGQPHVMRLEGEFAFHSAPLAPGYKARGTLISDIEFRVDLSSRYSPTEQTNPRGALIVHGGELFVMAEKAGDIFHDLYEIPLWGKYDEGTASEKVGFAKWSIAIRDGHECKTIWKHEPKQKSVSPPSQ